MKTTKFFTALCCTAMLFAACEKNEPNANNHDTKNDTKEAVDLGLSVKWATCNVGATKPEEYGNYYAWGEVSPKTNYDESTYTFSGRPDVLSATNDAASQNWGDNWRMPTIDEWQELIDNCTWTWTTKKGVNGFKVKATNGNSIFLPAAGFRGIGGLDYAGLGGYYWSSSLSTDDPSNAQGVYLGSGKHYTHHHDRFCGRSVRPVAK